MTKAKELNWCILYKKESKEEWNLPYGFANAMEKQNINLKRIEYPNSSVFKMPESDFIFKNKIQIILIFHSGFNMNLNNSLIDFRSRFPEMVIINELGDEPQTQICNYVRASLSTISLSPDYESHMYWRNKGFNCHWFNHWADESIFVNKKNKKRNILIGTSMGRRKYAMMLKTIFLNNFKNEKLNGYQNTDFYNSTLIAFQYARWGEITRRIFEAAASGCCVITNKLKEEKKLESIFNHNESIILYKNRFELLFELFKLIINKKKRERIAYNSEFIVKNSHTASARVEQLINIVDQHITEN